MSQSDIVGLLEGLLEADLKANAGVEDYTDPGVYPNNAAASSADQKFATWHTAVGEIVQLPALWSQVPDERFEINSCSDDDNAMHCCSQLLGAGVSADANDVYVILIVQCVKASATGLTFACRVESLDLREE